MNTRTYTTAEAAAQIGVSRQTLFTWIERRQIVPPTPVKTGQKFIRFWTKADIERARKFKGSQKRGPRPKRKR